MDQFRANAAARRTQVSASLDTGPAAMENALDRILVRAAQSGTTAAAAAPPPLSSSSTPPPQPGRGVPPIVAGIALAMGAGLLAVGVVTATGGEPAEVATPPAVTADVAVPTQPDLAPLPTVDPIDSTPTSPPTSTAESTPPTSAERESDVPVLVPIDPAPIDPVPTPDPVPTVDPIPTSTTATTVARPPDDESSPVLSPPPTATCGGQGPLPPGPVLIAEADFDADGEADVIAFYSTSSGPAAVIRRSSEGLTDVGFIGEKPVGDLSSQASARAVRPGPAEQQIVLLFDALDDDGSSVWARPVGLSECTPVGLDLPAEPDAPDGDLWNGASFTDAGIDYGLLCVDEGPFTVLSFRSFSDVGARLSLEADTATLQIDEIDTADGTGCWT